MNDAIASVRARQVLDSRGHPTVEVEVRCAGGALGRAIVPSGASTGRHEAVELRDGDPRHFGGQGVRRAVEHVNNILGPAVCGLPAGEQRTLDDLLVRQDDTPDKSRLGANAILGVSLAGAHAAASARGIPLWRHLDARDAARMPTPMVNLISGGLHAGRNLEFQDFLFIPLAARSYSECLETTVAVYRALAQSLKDAGFESVLVGDEGGFGPKLLGNEHALEFCTKAMERAGVTPGTHGGIALDVASTHFYDGSHYHLHGKKLEAEELVELLAGWAQAYPIVSIEDAMAEDDWVGWKRLTERLGAELQLIGDDLFVTNPARLQRGANENVANSILIKVNQIGTLTETLDVIAQAQANGYRCIVSARSGETEDTTIADLAVATGVGQIKIGSVARSERLAKYNQLLRIEEQFGLGTRFAHWIRPG
jgi:enolase